MSAEDLSRLTILVTRPGAQCESLCRLIGSAGGEGIPWPALEIEPVEPDPGARGRLANARFPDLAIFVSRNAVEHGLHLVPSDPGPGIAAIGPSTARALERVGRPPDFDSPGFDSEAMLAHPALTDMEGRHVFIIRGVGGRELLGETLRRRGASVEYLEVYRRLPRVSSEAARSALLHRWSRGGVHFYTATSVQLLEALYADLGQDFRELLASTPLVTASRRVVQRSKELGHRAERILAPGPDDRSLVAAIASWPGRPPGPAGRPESTT